MRVESSGFRLAANNETEATPTGDGRFTFPIYGETYEYFAGRPMVIPENDAPHDEHEGHSRRQNEG